MRARLPLSVIFGLLITLLTQSSYANELLIWDKLQGSAPKGYVLLLRHTLAPGVGDPENFKLNDCATQRNLSEVGRQDAKEVGEWLKRREIRIFRVESSRWCRAKETISFGDNFKSQALGLITEHQAWLKKLIDILGVIVKK